MPTAENAKLEYEGGQTPVAMSALSDSGDRMKFNSSASLWSGRSGFAPDIRPNGVKTGGEVIPAVSGNDDQVDVAALTCNLQGVETSVSADTGVAVTRPLTNVARVTSITIDNSGSVVAIAGTAGSDANFSETRGAAGGPPFIPVDSIEVAQVRLTTSAAAPVTSSEVYQVIGLHRETAAQLSPKVDYSTGSVSFIGALPAVHTGGVAKKVYASYSTPVFAEIDLASDFVPPGNTYSNNSKQLYRKTVASTTASLGAGSFTAYPNDGITDDLVDIKGELLWFRFYPDQYATAYHLVQGKLGVSRAFPADDQITLNCTISAETEGQDKAA